MFFEEITGELKNKIKNLKKRTPPQEIKNLIKELCNLRPLRLSEIATVLDRGVLSIFVKMILTI